MMRSISAMLAVGLLGGPTISCTDSPGETGPDATESTDTTARPDVIEEVYGLIGAYSRGTENPIKFELDDFKTGSIGDIRDLQLSRLATIPEDRHVVVARTTFQSFGLDQAAVYRPAWESGPRWREGHVKDMTLRELIQELQIDSRVEGTYVGYRVSMELSGQRASYSALWIQMETGDDVRDLYTIDHLVGTELVANAVRDRAARRRPMFEVYGTVDPAVAALVAATLYKHAPCPDPLVGAANAGNEKSEKGHDLGVPWDIVGDHHWFEWSLQGTCTYSDVGWGCSASCTGTATSSSGETSADDVPPYCHYISDSAAYGSGTADPNSSVTCSGAAMAVVKKCWCLWGCTVQVRILPMGVGVVIDADTGYDQFGPKNDSINCSGIPHS